MIGDGPDRLMAEQMCRNLGISKKVKFLGKLKLIENILSVADIFILPSETESFGLAALEAMAAGMPVISTNTGGLAEVNAHGFSGFLSDVGDIEDMSRNALRILSTPSSLEHYKANARIQAAKFDLPMILPLYIKLYQDLVLPLV